MLFLGLSQIRGYEPGDADWGVKLADVRGQEEAKEDVRRIVSLWQSGEAFEKAGGKRERGLIFHGAPGTGKTMLAKAIATGFNSPFVSIPGSGFAQTFIGIDALIVRFLARKAKKLARKWGGTCIVFIDEIDAVGLRRSALGTGSSMTAPAMPASFHDHAFYGPWGALNPTGDLILESRAWRERLFGLRAPESTSPYPPWMRRLGAIANQGVPGGMFGGGMGQLALNQLLVTMDGIDSPPFWRRFWTNQVNGILDASFVVPRRLGDVPLRLPPPRPRRARPGAQRSWSGVRHGTGPDRAPGRLRRRDSRGDAGADLEALREDRPPDHEPDGRGRHVRPRPDSRRPLRPRQAHWPRSCSARPTWRRTTCRPRPARRPKRCSSSGATTSRRSSTGRCWQPSRIASR